MPEPVDTKVNIMQHAILYQKLHFLHLQLLRVPFEPALI